MTKNVFIKVDNEFIANTIANAVKATEKSDIMDGVSKKVGMARKTGKLILGITEANGVAKALETYSKGTESAPAARMAKSLAGAIRLRTAIACKNAKLAAETVTA